MPRLANQDAEPPHGDFYVTVRDAGGRTGFLLGPYDDARNALANVERGKHLACTSSREGREGRAWFYAYGVARAPIGTSIRPLFGK
jgi:hypothetical protein